MAKSQRELDMQTERAVIVPFTMKYLLTKIFEKVENVEDAERQMKGIDVIIYDNDCDENLDIKAQASAKYINRPVPTFVMELLFTAKNKQEHIGWFLDDTETDTYVCIWIHAATTNERGMLESPEDIIDAEVMFVDKAPLQEYIESKGYAKDLLLQRARKLRKSGLYRQDAVIPGELDDEMWLSYTAELVEKPVNLVIKKRVLKKFSTRHVRVTKSGVFDIVNDVV